MMANSKDDDGKDEGLHPLIKESRNNTYLTEKLCIIHPRMNQIMKRLNECREWSKLAVEPECLLILGESGVGKTTIADKYLNENLPIEFEDVTVIPVLKASIPIPATKKSVVSELLQKLGDRTPYKGTLHQQTSRLCHLLEMCRVEIIILDEFQHIIDPDNERVLKSVADWLKILIEKSKLPIVLTGLPDSIKILSNNPQLRRRFSSQETLERFPITSSRDKKNFAKVLQIIGEKIPYESELPLDDEKMMRRFYVASKGLISRIMKIVRHAARDAEEKKTSVLTLKMFAAAYERSFVSDQDYEPNPFSPDWTPNSKI